MLVILLTVQFPWPACTTSHYVKFNSTVANLYASQVIKLSQIMDINLNKPALLFDSSLTQLLFQDFAKQHVVILTYICNTRIENAGLEMKLQYCGQSLTLTSG